MTIMVNPQNSEYTLTFLEALDAVMKNKGWAQGTEFQDGVVIRKNAEHTAFDGIAHIFNFSKKAHETRQTPLNINNGLYRQKFRIIETEPEAMRKI